MLYNWAAEHPDEVQCIGGIYTVCDPTSWPGTETAAPAYKLTPQEFAEQAHEHAPLNRLEPLARFEVPILHVHGDADTVVPLERNSGALIQKYKALGGPGYLEIVPGKGHQVCDEFFKNETLLTFFLGLGKHEQADNNQNAKER